MQFFPCEPLLSLVKIDFEIYVRAGARALDWNTVQWISLHISIVFCTQNIHRYPVIYNRKPLFLQ